MNKFKDFIGFFGDQINSQFGLGENKNASFSNLTGDQNFYNKISDFSNVIDKTEQRDYVEEGFLSNNFLSKQAKRKDIIWNAPEATVLVKKRMFSSLKQNYKEEYLDNDEYIFTQASKKLFANKCQQISSYERLSKLKNVIEVDNYIDPSLLPLVFDSLKSLKNDTSNSIYLNPEVSSTFDSVIGSVKQAMLFYAQNKTTTWIARSILSNGSFKGMLSKSLQDNGTGVIELTNFTSIFTSSGVSFDEMNSCTVDLDDPYELSIITENDIEKAISDVSGFKNGNIAKIGLENFNSLIEQRTIALSGLRSNRSAAQISFNYSPNVIFGKKMISFINHMGNPLEILFDADGISANAIGAIVGDSSLIKVYDDYLIGSELLGNNGLNKDELSLFKDIVSLSYKKMSLESSAESDVRLYNEKTNYIRRKMNLHYLGKTIIQPMDQIHIYFKSNQSRDENLLTGIRQTLNGQTYFDKLVNISSDLKNSLSIFGVKSEEVDIEKSIFGYPDMPNSIWSLYRNYYVKDSAGTHVYAGLVNRSNSRYNNGFFGLSISCSDMKEYLNKGKINFNPGVDQFNGSFFDPLTPFKTSFEDISNNSKTPEFLDINKKLLKGNYETSLVKAKFGNNSGKNVTTTNFISDSIPDSNGKLNNVFYAPDGLLYRWKEGISVLTQYGNSQSYNNSFYVGRSRISKSPFSGQDIINVISLSVTGIPYNYYTYYKATKQFGSSSDLFYAGLTNDLIKSNQMWGDFVPFKSQSVSQADVVNLYTTQQNITNDNERLNEYINQVQSIKFILQNSGLNKNNELVRSDADINQIKEIEETIISLSQKNSETLKNDNFKVFGNDVELSLEDEAYFGSSKDATRRKKSALSILRKTNALTRRVSRKVRENSDVNLFIVDDEYDQNIDISVFEKELQTAIQQYNSSSSYLSVKDQISLVANLLHMEVYCDTQGHIRARFPKYNKIPSSVFYRMIAVSRERGIRLFPKFLENLFQDQITNQLNQLSVLEDEIRLYGALFFSPNPNSDSELVLQINYSQDSKLSSFSFVSDASGSINYIELLSGQTSRSDDLEKAFSITFDQVKTQNNIKSLLSTAQLATTVLNNVETFIRNNVTTDNLFNNYVKNTLQRLELKTGQNIETSLRNELVGNATNNTNPVKFNYVLLLTKLQSSIANRQKSIKILSKAFQKLQQGRRIDQNNLSTSIQSFASNFTKEDENGLNDFYAGLIEDETYDDLGPNSGKRYIIDNAQILSYDIAENKPNYTYIEVAGVQGDFASGSLPNSAFDNGGLITAAAIDYDMWHMYGFQSQGSTVKIPFFTNVDTQCAPYAAYLLSNARKNILSGTISIVGNEYMQPGEVIYLPQRNLLFYVTSVSHSFNFGSNFETKLTVSYGHTPGEYIPTTLDVIGKTIYNNSRKNEFVVYRQADGNAIGALEVHGKNATELASEDILSSNDNRNLLEKLGLLLKAAIANANRILINESIGSNIIANETGIDNKNSQYVQKPTIEFRFYNAALYNNINPSIEVIISYIKKSANLDSVPYEIKLINKGDDITPSQAAISLSRKISIQSNSQKAIMGDMEYSFDSVVDCYIVFKDGEV